MTLCSKQLCSLHIVADDLLKQCVVSVLQRQNGCLLCIVIWNKKNGFPTALSWPIYQYEDYYDPLLLNI